jgi:polar amino acid transport system substrate-binding protein
MRHRKSIKILSLVLSLPIVAVLAAVIPGNAAAATCAEVKAKHASLSGREIKIGISPFSPGYEVADPKDPSKIVGFDPDMVQAVTDCIGVKYSFQSMDFGGLVGALEPGRIDMIFSSMYATPERAKKVTFVVYQKASTGGVVAKGNPKGITSFQSLCGLTAAEVTGTVEAETLATESQKCTAAGKGEITISQYKDNDACLRAVQVGRADIFMTDAGLAAALARQFSDTLDKSFTVASDYRFGVGVRKEDTDLLNAVYDALLAIQADGTEAKLLAKWGFASDQLEPARIVTQ